MTSLHKPPPGLPRDSEALNNKSHHDLNNTQLAQLVDDVKDFQLTHGNLLKLVRFEEDTRVPSVGTPVSLIPTSFPRRFYNQAWNLQQSMTELYIRAASDEDWLYSVLQPLLEHDDLLVALWDVHVKVKDAGVVQDVVCGIFRSDYMLHDTPGGVELKQVEVNTLAVAGACHATRVAEMHRHLQCVRDLGKDPQEQQFKNLPVSNDSISSIAKALALANEQYSTGPAGSRCILMVVQPFNINVADERPIEYALWTRGTPCYRCEWQYIMEQTYMTTDRKLMYQRPGGDRALEVGVVYYRAGYEVAEYDNKGKDVRLRLESSRAIKCPDVLTHLTTFKAVQQALMRSGTVERFLGPGKKAEWIDEVRETFMPMHSLDSSEAGLHARSLATDPTRVVNYVLKPNLEGGGHNIFGAAIPAFLARVPETEWQTFTLMRLITPPQDVPGVLMTGEGLHSGPVVSELGVVGTAVWKRGEGREVEVLWNEPAGWTFKTKARGVDEMSVVKGYGCFDCPLLVE